MAKRYALKEVANVIFFDIATNKPSIFFDTLKVSSIENESESAEARGGQGNSKLVSWDYGRTATLNMQDALLSDTSLAMLAGTEVKKTGIKAVGRDTLEVVGGEATLSETPIAGTLVIYNIVGGIISGDEIPSSTYTLTGDELEFTVVPTGKVMAFYEYTAGADATQVTFSGKAFPSTYRVVGETLVREQSTGQDRKMQFHISKAKLQSTFSLTMDVENVSTFDFNLEILLDTESDKLYDIIRL